MDNKFSNKNITNYVLAFILVTVSAISIMVFYQYYAHDKFPPDEFLKLVFNTVILELFAMAGISISKNIRRD